MEFPGEGNTVRLRLTLSYLDWRIEFICAPFNVFSNSVYKTCRFNSKSNLHTERYIMARNTSFHTRHADKSNNFNSQDGNRSHQQPRQFDKRSAQPEEPVRVDRKAVIRRQAFKKLIADIQDGVSKIAVVSELPEERVKRLYEGQDVIDAPMAMHLEESIGLPDGWLESDKPIPQDVFSRLDRSLGAHDEDAFTIDVDGSPEKNQSKDEGDVIEALSQSANNIQDGQNAGGEETMDDDEATMNILQLKDLFPAVHVVLHQKTNLSPASISGILSGSRNLTDTNAELFEGALNLPHGWLRQSMTLEQAEADLVQAVGDLINMPAPRRGRRSSNEESVAVAQPKARAAKPAKAAKPVKAAKPARVLAPMPTFASPAPVAKPVVAEAAPATQVVAAPAVRPYVEAAAPRASAAPASNKMTLEAVPGGMSLSRALINELEKLEAKGQLDNIKVTRVLNALYMN